MSGVLKQLSDASELAKRLINLTTLSRDVEAKEMISQLQLRLAELRGQFAELLEENHDLRKQLQNRHELPSVQLGDHGLYYTENGDGPFCTTCFDSDQKLVRVTELGAVFRTHGKWRCGVCKNKYH